MSGMIREHRGMHGVLLGVLLLTACDAGAFAPGVDGGYPSLRVYANVASTAVTGLSVEVSAADISPALWYNIPISDGVATGTVQVPTGTNRLFTLRAYDAGAVETHRGSATVSIVDGPNPPLEITLMPLEGEREIDATLGSIIVVVSPAVDTTAVGDSIRLGAVVIDSLGDNVPNASVHWATLAPSIATVDSRGMVFGMAPGDANIVATYGAVGGSATIAVVEAGSEEPGTPASVTVTPSEATIRGTAETAQLEAEARDADGNVVPGSDFAWSSADTNIATVSQEGLVTSTGLGTTVITAALLCGGTACEGGSLVGNSEITVVERSERYPNEPAGFVPWFEHDWQTMVTDFNQEIPASGVGWLRSWSENTNSVFPDNTELVDDPDAPHGFGKSVRIRWQEGQDGAGPSMFGCLREPYGGSLQNKISLQKWYISYWVYWEPNPLDGMVEMAAGQMRQYSVNRQHTGRAMYGWTFRSYASDAPRDVFQSYRLWGYPSSGGSSVTHAESSPGPAVGEWLHIETVMDRTVKAPPLWGSSGDMAIKVWVNGEVLLDTIAGDFYSEHPFLEFAVTLVGSGGSIRTRADYMRISGIYISGEEYRP
jgi:hypothetical protein